MQKIEDDGDELYMAPSNPQGTHGGQAQTAPMTATAQQQISDAPEGLSRTRPEFTPTSDSGPTATPSRRGRAPTIDPFMEEDEDEGKLDKPPPADRPLSGRNALPTPAVAASSVSAYAPPYVATGPPPAATPPPASTPPRAVAASPSGRSQPAPSTTPNSARRNLNTFSGMKGWSPLNKPNPNQRQDPSPEISSATAGRGNQAVQGGDQVETARQPLGNHPDQPAEARPAEWGDEWVGRGGGTLVTPYRPGDRRPACPGTGAHRREPARGQDKDVINDANLQPGSRARAFDSLFNRVQTERLFQDEELFDTTRDFATTREPRIDLKVLDDLNDASINTFHAWLIDNGRDAPQELQDRLVKEVTRAFEDVRDRIGELVLKEEIYVIQIAENLATLLARPTGRTRSATSRTSSSAASAVLPERDCEPLNRENLTKLSKERVIDFLFKRDGQRATHIEDLQAICDNFETKITELEEEVHQQAVANAEQVATEQERVQVAIDTVLGAIPPGGAMPGRRTANQRSRRISRAPPSRISTPTSSSSGGSQRSAGPAVTRLTPLTAQGIPPMPVDTTDQPEDAATDLVRQQLFEDLQDIWRNAEAADELSLRFIRQTARNSNVPLQPGMEEGARLDLAALDSATAESTTPAQLVVRIHQLTMERDRARRAEMEAREQLRLLELTQQQPVTPPTALTGRLNAFGKAPATLVQQTVTPVSSFMRQISGLRQIQPGSTAVTTPITPAPPPTASLNPRSLVRLLRIASQLADELSCSSDATSNLAQVMVRCGGMNTGSSLVLPALNNLRNTVQNLKTLRPENPRDNDLSGGDERWQALYLGELEAYMTQVRRQVTGAINTLANSVNEWHRTNQKVNDDAGEAGSSAGRPTNEQGPMVNVWPSVAGWAVNHPHPCEHCTPVLQVPDDLGEINTCGCTCGTRGGVEERGGETRSQGSARSVSFADEKSGILRNGRRGPRPGRLDMAKAEPHRSVSSSGDNSRPSTPHPLGSAHDRGSNPLSSGSSASVPRGRHYCNCNCRRGVPVAYYMCTNANVQVADNEGASRRRTTDYSQAAEGTRAGAKAPWTIEEWLREVVVDVASMVRWGSPRVSHASYYTATQDPTQLPLAPSSVLSSRATPPSVSSARSSAHTPPALNQYQIPLPPSSAASSQGAPPSVPSAASSPHTPPGQPPAQDPPGQRRTPSPRPMPFWAEAPWKRQRRAIAPGTIGTPLTPLPQVPEAGPEDVDRGRGHKQPAEEQNGNGQNGDEQAGDEQLGANPAPEHAPAPPAHQPATQGPAFWDLLRNDPFLVLMKNIVSFLTFGQLHNALVTLLFLLSAVWYYASLVLYVVLRHMARQNVARPLGPALPRHEMLSLLAWAALVWWVMMSIALDEERRIWHNANPQLELRYFRGMPYRRMYPWWALYLVDADLMGPALGGLSLFVHGLVFSSGDSKLGWVSFFG